NPGAAQADPDEFIECRLAIIKAPPAGSAGQGYSKFVCRGTFTLPSAGAAPSGSGFRIGLNPGPPGFVFPPSDLAFTFCSGLGNPPGSRGYRCHVLPFVPRFILKANAIAGVFKKDLPAQYAVPHPYPSGNLRLVVETVGSSDTKRYCGRFTNPIRNDASEYRSTVAPTPAGAPPR